MHHMLPGAAAGLQHVARFAVKEPLQHGPDRRMVAVESGRVEPAVGFASPSLPNSTENPAIHRSASAAR